MAITERVREAQNFYRLMESREALKERIRYAAVIDNTSEIERVSRVTVGSVTLTALVNFASVRIHAIIQLLAIDSVRSALVTLDKSS